MKIGKVIRRESLNYKGEIDLYDCPTNFRGTSSGYGSKLPMPYAVFYNGRYRRVYCTIYSNVGTCWFMCGGEKMIVG